MKVGFIVMTQKRSSRLPVNSTSKRKSVQLRPNFTREYIFLNR